METTDMALEEVCQHVKLASWRDPLTGYHCYQCMGCGAQIEIPAFPNQVLDPAIEANIIGLVFGGKWREKMIGGDHERRWNH